MKKVLKIFGVLVLVLGVGIFLLYIFSQIVPPPQITVNFTELDKINKISKYRSCAGHTTVPQNESESRRSMKHYFAVKPEYLGNNTVSIYAPFDGIVTVVRKDLADGLEGEIWIIPDNIFAILPPIGQWSFSIQHINIKDGINRGSKVSAGEIIGYAAISEGFRNTFDVVYAKQALFPKKIDNWNSPFSDLNSVFSHMSDKVFMEYQEKGIKSKTDLIITAEERDKNPCVYKDGGPYFLDQDNLGNWPSLK